MFTFIDNAVATQNRASSSKYAEALGNLAVATKQADGTFAGAAIECEKVGQVLSFREAAKHLGVGLVTRKQADGKVRVWKVAATDKPIRNVKANAEPKAPKAKKAAKAKA